jgi:tetratricopeptide (TPR) repeat protein
VKDEQTWFSTKIIGAGIILALFLGLLGLFFPRNNRVDIRYRLEIVSLYQITGRNHEAAQILNQIVSAGIRDPEILGAIGEQYRLIRDYPSSIKYLEMAVSKSPVNRKYLYSLAQSYNSAEMKPESLSVYNKLLELYPDPIYNIELANIYLSLNERDLALEKYQLVLEMDPANWEAYSSQGDIFMELEQFEEASFSYRKALEITENNLLLQIKLGLSYIAKQDFDRAMEIFSVASESNPGSPEPYYYKGLTFFRQGEFSRAIEPYEKAIDINDRYVQAYVDLGKIHIFYSRCSIAMPLLEKALNLNPLNIEASEGVEACK